MAGVMRPTIEQVNALTENEIGPVTATFDQVSSTALFMEATLMITRTRTVGDPHELAQMLHWSQIKRPNLFPLYDAIRWAYLADLHRDALTREQHEVLTRAWALARPAAAEGDTRAG